MKAEKIELRTRDGRPVTFYVAETITVEVNHPTGGRMIGITYGYRDGGVEAEFSVGARRFSVRIGITLDQWKTLQEANRQWRRRVRENEERQRAERRRRAEAECPPDCEVAERKSVYDMTAIYVLSDGTEVWHAADVPSRHGFCYIPRDVAERARAEAARERAEREAAERAEREKLAAALRKARETGEPQVLRRWITDECMKGRRDCSFDQAVERVFPDGHTEVTYSCCY